jgi:hypothetical protein
MEPDVSVTSRPCSLSSKAYWAIRRFSLVSKIKPALTTSRCRFLGLENYDEFVVLAADFVAELNTFIFFVKGMALMHMPGERSWSAVPQKADRS